MPSRPLALLAVLALSLEFVGCDSRSSVAPTALASNPLPVVQAPALPAVPEGGWRLTTTLSSATGSSRCAVDISHMHVGDSYAAWLLTIERAGESVHLVVSDLRNPADRYEYEGTVVADILTAAIKNPADAGWCGGRVTFSGESSLSGRFSADGHTLTAEAVDTIRLDNSGETFSLHYDWTATLP